MSNTTVRTMKDDIEESKKKAMSSNNPVKKKEVEKTNPTVSILKNNLEKTNDSANTVKFSGSVNDAQTNELKNLINKISEQTDKDVDTNYDHNDKNQIKQEDSSSALQKETKQQSKEETVTPQPIKEKSIENDNIEKPTIETNVKEDQTEKESLNDVAVEKKSENVNNNQDINDLKNLINKISNVPSKKSSQTVGIKKSPSTAIKEKPKNINNKEIENLKPNTTVTKTKSVVEKQIETNLAKEIKPVKKNLPEATINHKNSTEEREKVEEKKEKVSFWNKVSKNIKKTSSSKKVSALTSPEKTNKTTDDIKKDIASSGVLKSSQEIKEKNDSENKKKLISNYYQANYVSPTDRLSQNKQELYSSLSKKIKLKGEKGELDALKETEEGKKKQKEITKDEEYKELKKSIKQKYHIRLSLLPWKKIIVISVIVLTVVGVGMWKLFSMISPPELPPEDYEIVLGEEIDEFADVKNKITFTENKFNVPQLESDANKIFNQDKAINIIKLEIIDNDNTKNIVTFEKALEVIGIKNNKTTLPSDFLGLTTNLYNIFIFKTTKNPISIRYGIAVKTEKEDELKTTMKLWERNRIENQKMIKILKPLFIDDSGFEQTYANFTSINYSKENIELRYVGLIGSETALDYFIHKNILVITTSKDSIFIMTDILIN